MESERKIADYDVLVKTKSDEIKSTIQSNGEQVIHQNGKENINPNMENTEINIRRHDEPSALSFEICT